MKPARYLIAFLCLALCRHTLAQTNDIDAELSNLASNLAGQIESQNKKKVAVIDFTDLDGGASELGKYIAEQLTVNLVMDRKDFSVLDRTNLKKILAEHKLTATGLVDPDNAKKLGMFAGVDAIILGTIVPKAHTTGLTAEIITTDTAEIVGATKAEFKTDASVQQLIAKPTVETNQAEATASSSDESAKPEKPKVSKQFGDLYVEAQPLQIVNNREYNLMLTLTNRSATKTIWVALNADNGGNVKGFVIDPNGSQFSVASRDISGIESSSNQNGTFYNATAIRPGDSLMATVKFFSFDGRSASSGHCNFQLEFLVGYDFAPGYGSCAMENFVGKIDAD